MKTLPNLYKIDNHNIKDNNKKNCIVKEYEINHNVLEALDEIFNLNGFSFDKKVLIKTNDKLYKTYLVSRDNDKVKTLNEEEIAIKNIISIERI